MTTDAGAAERAGPSRRRLTKSESLKNSCFKECNCSESLHNTPCLVKLYCYFVLHTFSPPTLPPLNHTPPSSTTLPTSHPIQQLCIGSNICTLRFSHRPVRHTSSTHQPHLSHPLLRPQLNQPNSKQCEFFLSNLRECWTAHSLLVLNCSCKSSVAAHSEGHDLRKTEPREGQR